MTPEHVPEGLLLGSYGASDPPGWCARWYGAQGAVGEERAVSALLRAASGGGTFMQAARMLRSATDARVEPRASTVSRCWGLCRIVQATFGEFRFHALG